MAGCYRIADMSDQLYRRDNVQQQVYVSSDMWVRQTISRENFCFYFVVLVILRIAHTADCGLVDSSELIMWENDDSVQTQYYSRTSVHKRLGSRTIRFINKFSEHKASWMTYCVSSYEHACRQKRKTIPFQTVTFHLLTTFHLSCQLSSIQVR